jgi:hypothetical protein
MRFSKRIINRFFAVLACEQLQCTFRNRAVLIGLFLIVPKKKIYKIQHQKQSVTFRSNNYNRKLKSIFKQLNI